MYIPISLYVPFPQMVANNASFRAHVIAMFERAKIRFHSSVLGMDFILCYYVVTEYIYQRGMQCRDIKREEVGERNAEVTFCPST